MVVLGVWSDAMFTLAATIVATVVVMIFGLVFGVWMGRSKMADRILRPILDAGQTMPAFVYLVPFLALFGASRFTAIIAGVVYAAPAAIKIIADGISQVSTNTVEAATVERIHHLAADHQGAAADVGEGAGAGHQPGADLRRCRWSSSAAWSAPARSATTWWPGCRRTTCSARAWPPA